MFLVVVVKKSNMGKCQILKTFLSTETQQLKATRQMGAVGVVFFVCLFFVGFLFVWF